MLAWQPGVVQEAAAVAQGPSRITQQNVAPSGLGRALR